MAVHFFAPYSGDTLGDQVCANTDYWCRVYRVPPAAQAPVDRANAF